jgi:hypothetical protein
MGKIVVWFDPATGHVTSSEIREPPFRDTAVGECIARIFLRARMPPFDEQKPVAVMKPFKIE